MSRMFTSKAIIFLTMATVLLVHTSSSHATSSSSPAEAPGPSSDCMTSLFNMSDCLTYVEMGAKIAKPDKGCCPELAGLVESNPICLCQLLGNSDSIGIQIDLDRALKLPSLCKVETPPVSLCSAVGVPVGGPTSSTEESMSPGASSPMGSAASSPGGSSAPAAADKSENGAQSSTARSTPVLAMLLVVAFALTFF